MNNMIEKIKDFSGERKFIVVIDVLWTAREKAFFDTMFGEYNYYFRRTKDVDLTSLLEYVSNHNKYTLSYNNFIVFCHSKTNRIRVQLCNLATNQQRKQIGQVFKGDEDEEI